MNRPIPTNELERILNLSEYNIDFANIQNNFIELTKLAAGIAGTDISLVNLVDSYTQWTVSGYGLEIKQMPRDESICQYTIMEQDMFEVTDLSSDTRFNNLDYVAGDLALRYYFGVPLTTSEGFNIGALCVLHSETKQLSEEEINQLRIIADEIVNRLRAIKVIEQLRFAIHEKTYTQKKIVHDIRGPLSGVIGLTDLIINKGHDNDMEEVLEYMHLIKNGGSSIISMANEILTAQKVQESTGGEMFNLVVFKEKLEHLFLPQAVHKDLRFSVKISEETKLVPISKFNLLQVTGNLISNAIKFTSRGGSVYVEISLQVEDISSVLYIKVTDTGIGLSSAQINSILTGAGESTAGTIGEVGFGFGLAMVKNLIESMSGELKISSQQGKGTTFEVIFSQ